MGLGRHTAWTFSAVQINKNQTPDQRQPAPSPGSEVTVQRSGEALSLGHDVLQPLQQHVGAAAALGTSPLAGGGRGRGQLVPVAGEDPLPAHAALLDDAVDGR